MIFGSNARVLAPVCGDSMRDSSDGMRMGAADACGTTMLRPQM